MFIACPAPGGVVIERGRVVWGESGLLRTPWCRDSRQQQGVVVRGLYLAGVEAQGWRGATQGDLIVLDRTVHNESDRLALRAEKSIDPAMERVAGALPAKEGITRMRAAFDKRVAEGLIGDDDVRLGLRKRKHRSFVAPHGGGFRVKMRHTQQEKAHGIERAHKHRADQEAKHGDQFGMLQNNCSA